MIRDLLRPVFGNVAHQGTCDSVWYLRMVAAVLVFMGLFLLPGAGYADEAFIPKYDSVVETESTFFGELGFTVPGDTAKMKSGVLADAMNWHLLYRAGVDSALEKSAQALKRVSGAEPDPDARWVSALNALWSGHFRTGLTLIDSLRKHAGESKPYFVDTYIRECAHFFLPGYYPENATTVSLQSPGGVADGFLLSLEDAIPYRRKVSVVTSDTMSALPTVNFKASFSIAPVLPLNFSLVATKKLSLALHVDTGKTGAILDGGLHDWFSERSPMEIEVMAIPNQLSASLDRQMAALVGREYTMVRRLADLKRFGALSFRCKTTSVFSDVPGTYCAFVGFDALLSISQRTVRIRPLQKKIGREEVVVRYLIAMRSSDDAAPKAEKVLQNLLFALNNRS